MNVSEMEYAPDNSSGIHVVQDDDHNLLLRLERSDDSLIVGLWQVVMTINRHYERDRKLTPVTSMALVIAENEDGAISQVHDIAWGTDTGYHDWKEAVASGELIATATRVPLHIRGWGTHTF